MLCQNIKKYYNITAFSKYCNLEYVETDDFSELDDTKISKAHAICLNQTTGKAYLVYLKLFNVWGLPGGTRELGESIDQALAREISEEINCNIISKHPIGYYKLINPNDCNEFRYRLVYLSYVVPNGKPIKDVAGMVSKVIWIDPTKFENFIENQEYKRLPWHSMLNYMKKRK